MKSQMVLVKHDPRGQRGERVTPIIQRVDKVYSDGRVRTSSGDTWAVKKKKVSLKLGGQWFKANYVTVS